jgi:hypothetical protein
MHQRNSLFSSCLPSSQCELLCILVVEVHVNHFRLTMSAIFRTLAAATKTISQALAMAGVTVLAIVIYTGFAIQRSYM